MKPLVLTWHSVETNARRPKHIDYNNPPASLFRQQIEFILRSYQPVSISEFIGIIQDGKTRRNYTKPPVLLTFDDGFRNVVTQALPVLCEFGVPAVLFVIVGVLKNPDFVPWFVEMKHIIRKTPQRTVIYNDTTFNLSSAENHVALQRTFGTSFKTCKSEQERQTLLSSFAQLLNVDRPTASTLEDDLRLVTKEDLKTLDSSVLTVGSHAMTHRNLASLTYEEQVYELEQSHLILQENCSSYYPVVAYPSGSFDAHTTIMARSIYKAGLAVLTGSSYRNLYAYPRIGIGNDSVQELAWAISTKRLRYALPVKRLLRAVGYSR